MKGNLSLSWPYGGCKIPNDGTPPVLGSIFWEIFHAYRTEIREICRDDFPVRSLFVGIEWGVCACAAQDQEASFGSSAQRTDRSRAADSARFDCRRAAASHVSEWAADYYCGQFNARLHSSSGKEADRSGHRGAGGK